MRTVTRYIAIGVALVGLAAPVHADDSSVVGLVDRVRPANLPFQIQRGAQRLSVRVGMSVYVGDRVTIPATGAITLMLADGQPHEYSGIPMFVVPAVARATMLAKVIHMIGSIFDDGPDEGSGDTIVLRGGTHCNKPIEVTALRPGAKMLAGTRPLELAWTGGCAPFTVSVLRSNGLSLISVGNLTARSTKLAAATFPVGVYLVTVTDGRAHTRESPLQVVAVGPPPRPACRQSARSSASLRGQSGWQTSSAGFGASRRSGSWGYEPRPAIRSPRRWPR